MKNLFIVVLMFLTSLCFGQNRIGEIHRKGFVFGAGFGGGYISIATGNSEKLLDKTDASISLPNLKFGWMLNERIALVIQFPGMIYELDGKDRGFESVLPSIQFWTTNNCWINAGIGLAVDLPTFYDVENLKNENWYFGGAVALSTGYEIFQHKNFAVDLQSRIQLGRVNLTDDLYRDGVSFMVGIGINWY